LKRLFQLRILIPLLLFGSSCLAGFLSLVYLLPEDEREIEERAILNVHQNMKLLQSSVNIMLRRNDFDGVRMQMASIMTDDQINHVMVLDDNAVVMLAADNSHEDKMYADFLPLMEHIVSSKRENAASGEASLSSDGYNVRAVYPLYRPIDKRGLRQHQTGWLVYERSIRRDKIIAINKDIKKMFTVIAIMLFISLLLGFFFHFRISRRVDKLLYMTTQLPLNDALIDCDLSGRDEFSAIAQALNEMMNRLCEKNIELTRSELRLRKSQSFARMGNWDWNIETGELYWSESVAPMFGLDVRRKYVNYKSFIKCVHPDDRQKIEEAIQLSIKEDATYDVVHRIILPDDSICWLHETGNVDRDEKGKPLHMMGIVRDVTEQKNFDLYFLKILRELHYQKYALDQHSLVAVTDLTGKITYSNEKFSSLSGYRYNELIGQTHRIVNSGHHSKEFFTNLWRTIQHGDIWQGGICNRNKNGDEYWVDTTIVPYLDEKGKPNKYIAILTDVTQRKRTEEKLLLQASALNAAADGIVITDSKGKIEYVNRAFTALTGYQYSEAVGAKASILKSDKHDSVFYKNMWDTILGGNTWQGELWNKRKDDSLYFEEESITPVVSENGAINHFIAIKRDVSDRNKLQQQLQQAQKMEAIGQLTGGIAHDFNNILASIMGFTELANEGLGHIEEEKIKHYLSSIYKSGTRARDLVLQMLAFSQGGGGEYKEFNLLELLNESLKMLKAIIPSSIETTLIYDDDAYVIMTNPVQLHQLILNLFINARDAIKGIGHIHIEILHVESIATECSSCFEKISGNYVQLMISDTGSGIQTDQIERIFDPFFTTKEVGKGSGMGLSMVHGLIHDHGGHVIVDTNKDGCSFSLLFPLPDKASKYRNVHAQSENPLEHIIHGRVLIVDDEPSVGLFMAELLKSRGVMVTVESDSQKALSLFTENPHDFDLVVTDQTMPNLQGYDLALLMFAIRPELPVILCSGYSELINEEKAMEIGIRGYLNKPIDTDVFLSLIGKLIKEHLSKDKYEK